MKPGDQVRDYILEQRIGAGGVGEVWRARHIRLNKPVAVKLILPHLVQDENIYSRFVQEAIATANLEHPHIISVHDFFSVGDDAFLVMSFIEGGSLQDRIKKRRRLSLAETLHIARGMLDALDFAHQKGIVHRDVKPSNILLSPDLHAYLVDFGIALVLGKTRITRFGASIGTPDYMSPEQIRGEQLDHRTDVYSFGCVLYEMLTGRSPFRRSDDDTEFTLMERHMNEAPASIRSLEASLSQETETVIMRALAKDREKRFAGCADMAKALVAATAADVGGSSKPVDNAARALKVAVAVLAVTTLVAAGGWMAGSGEKNSGDSANSLRKEFADTIAAKEQAEKELQALRAQLEASRSSDRASVDQSQKELQAAKAAQVKAEQDANYWKDQAAKKRASSEQSDDIRVAKLQKDLQSVNAAKDNAVKEVNHWKDQVAKLQREIQASKKTATGSAKPSGEIASHLAAARKYREGGAYDSALAELRAASTLYPANEEIAAEIDKTKRACNAEKRLGRTDLKC